CERRLEEGRWLGFAGGFESGRGDLIASRIVGVGRNDVEEIGRHAGIGDVSGDARAHRSGPEYCDFMNALHGTGTPLGSNAASCEIKSKSQRTCRKLMPL